MLKKHWKSLLWATLILLAFSLPGDKVTKVSLFRIPHFDKIVHFTLIMVLALLLISELNRLKEELKVQMSALFWATVVSTGYGVLIEGLQHFLFSSRTASYWDVLANLMGAIAAVFFYRFINRLTKGYL